MRALLMLFENIGILRKKGGWKSPLWLSFCSTNSKISRELDPGVNMGEGKRWVDAVLICLKKEIKKQHESK